MPSPPPCNDKVFKKGHSAIILDGCSHRVEKWVKAVAKESGQAVDWHYSGGRANVLYVGDFKKVQAAIEKLLPELEKAPSKEGHSCRCLGPKHGAMSVLARPSLGDDHGPYRDGDLG
jgi:hypothetical protein